MSSAQTPSFVEWKQQKRDELITRFAEAFGAQYQEWPDFAERAYLEQFPDANSGRESPA